MTTTTTNRPKPVAQVQEITPCERHWFGRIPSNCPDCVYGEIREVTPR